MQKRVLILMINMIVLMFTISCKSEYTRAVEKGLSSGVINDSLIFGMRMGQTKKDFFDTCLQLNKRMLVSEGPGNQSARYLEPLEIVKDTLSRKEMLFYGIFDENDIMIGMDMAFSYYTWAPWLSDRNSTSLAEELKIIFEQGYKGNNFIPIDLGNEKFKAYVKIDGNRQILIVPKDEKEVMVKIEDLRTKDYVKPKNNN